MEVTNFSLRRGIPAGRNDKFGGILYLSVELLCLIIGCSVVAIIRTINHKEIYHKVTCFLTKPIGRIQIPSFMYASSMTVDLLLYSV